MDFEALDVLIHFCL